MSRTLLNSWDSVHSFRNAWQNYRKEKGFFRYFWQSPKKPDVLTIYNNAIRKENESFFKKGVWPFFPMPLFLFPFPFQSVLLNSSALCPNFFSGIVERAKREHAWKSPLGVSPFPRDVIFTRAHVSLALLSLRKNEHYLWSKARLNVLVFCSFFLCFDLFYFVFSFNAYLYDYHDFSYLPILNRS